MSTDFNPPCKFHDKQKVKIISGLHKGKAGTIKDCTVHRKGHADYQMVTPKTWNEFTYIVQVRTWLWFTREVYVMESQIAPYNYEEVTKNTFTQMALDSAQTKIKESNLKIEQLEGKVKSLEYQIELYKKKVKNVK